MRFYELIEAAHVGIADARIMAVELPHRGQSGGTNKLTRYPRYVLLVIRLMPAVYKELDLRIGHGDPDASIVIDGAWVTFPEPYNEAGNISVHCRRWIMRMVQDAAISLGFRMCVLFDDGPVYVRTNGDLTVGGRAPQGGLRF